MSMPGGAMPSASKSWMLRIAASRLARVIELGSPSCALIVSLTAWAKISPAMKAGAPKPSGLLSYFRNPSSVGVRALVLERQEVDPHVLTLDRAAALLDEALVVALRRAVPDLHGVDALDLRLLAHQHGALVVESVAAVRGVVRLDRLHDLRVVGLDRGAAHAELGVTLDAHLVRGPEERHRRRDRRREILRDHEHTVQRVRAELA